MNTKKIMVGLITGAILFGTASAAFADEDYTGRASSTTKTKYVTDEAGNEYEVLHVIEDVDGEITEYHENVPLILHNDTDTDIVAFYAANSNGDSWGENGFDYLDENFILEAGDTAYGMRILYYVDNPVFDIRIDMADGSEKEFDEINLDRKAEPERIDMTLSVNEEGDYELTVEESGKDEDDLSDATEINWSDFEDTLDSDERLESGSFYEDDEIGVKYYIPGNMSEVELEEEDLAEGFIRFFYGDKEEKFSICVSEDEEIKDVTDYEKKLREEYEMDTFFAIINDIPCVMYSVPEEEVVDEKVVTVAIAADGTILEFIYSPAEEDGEYAKILPAMIASIQIL